MLVSRILFYPAPQTKPNRLNSQATCTELTLHWFIRGLPSGIHWPEIPTYQANAFVTVVLYSRGLSYINQKQVSPGELSKISRRQV